MFGGKAKRENELLKERVAELEGRVLQMGGGELSRIEELKKQSAADLEEISKQRDAVRSEIAQLEGARATVSARIAGEEANLINVREAAELQSFGLFNFEHPAEDSVRLEAELERVRARIKEMVRNKQAVMAASGFTYNNSTAKGRSFVNKLSKIALRSYNAEVENATLRMKAGNLQAGIKRVEKARTEVARLGDMISLQINHAYHQLRLSELSLAFQHLQAKQALKDQEREERARLREEKKAQQEMEAERKRLQKEKSHYENALEKLRAQGRDDEAVELETKIAEIQRGIEDVDYRAANIRAGYVYVISNIGSFGERMVKIGMTRRLDPMDRVRELGDASVPFNFDVHALHFSEDAVGIEAALHRQFEKVKVNRINNRREFFYATAAEVKQALMELDGNVLEYHDEAEAEQYRLSLEIASNENG